MGSLMYVYLICKNEKNEKVFYLFFINFEQIFVIIEQLPLYSVIILRNIFLCNLFDILLIMYIGTYK